MDKKQSRFTAEERHAFWKLAVDTWKSSGMSINDFCRQEELAKRTFYRWRHRIRTARAEERNVFAHDAPSRSAPICDDAPSARMPGGDRSAGSKPSDSARFPEPASPRPTSSKHASLATAKSSAQFLEIPLGPEAKDPLTPNREGSEAQAASSQTAIELRLNGALIGVRPGFDAPTLRRVLSVLEDRRC